MKALIPLGVILGAAAFLFFQSSGAAEPGLALLDAGSGEKRVLRYTPTAGTRFEVVMTMDIDLGLGLKPPTTSFTMAIDVTDVSPEGDITYRFAFTDVGVDGREAPAQLKSLLDITGTAVVDSRGINKSGRIDLPDDMPASVKQMMGKFEEQMQQMSCPFPEEAVGVGATWKVTQVIETPVFGLTQVGTFELVEFDGNKGKLKLTITQSAEDQEMKGLGGGVKATLVSLDSKGTGELEFDLTKPIPVNSRIDVSSDVVIRVKEQTQRQKITLKVTLKEKKKK